MANQDGSPGRQYVQNLALAAVAGQAGCASVVIIMAALLIGLWLDSQLDWRGPFTIGLLVCSMPVSILVMLKIALGAVGRIDPQQQQSPHLVEHRPDEEELTEN
jgi:MFS family permease